MSRASRDKKIIASLVVLLLFEITLLALHLTWGGFTPHHSTDQRVLAGYVVKNENELHRRGMNNLVWEQAIHNDSLYYYDSVLTLSQSTAKLKLFKETEIQLSENTLVTIEPQTDGDNGEIRLKFHRGGLQARNPFSTTHVESESWTMELKTGSDIDLRQISENNFELNVKGGSVTFSNAEGRQQIGKDQSLRISEFATQKMSLAPFQWIKSPPARIYTHARDEVVQLSWLGNAKEIVQQSLSQGEITHSISNGSNERTLQLPLGHHRLYLRDSNMTSQPLDVEVWPAPIIHLVQPLPRNRIKTNQLTRFVWTWAPGIRSFTIQLKSAKKSIEQQRDDNDFSNIFTEEDDLQWSVYGADENGFAIPPLYSYPLFIREAPLAAPKLHGPEIRTPASTDNKGASHWFWNLIFPQASAAEVNYQAKFSWENVEGADHYYIEISETADFRTPVVQAETPKSEFIWRNIKLKTYFWRVAAGTKSGRLGYFSDPQAIDLAKPNQAVQVSQVKAVPQAKPPVILAPPTEVAPQPIVETPTSQPPPPAPLKFNGYHRVVFRPVYHIMKTQEPKNVSTDLRGVSIIGFAAETEQPGEEENAWFYRMSYARFKYNPTPETEYPFQPELTWSEFSSQAFTHSQTRNFGWGVELRHTAHFERTDKEKIGVVDVYLIGPGVEWLWRSSRIEFLSQLVILVGNEQGISTSHRLTLPFQSGLRMGAEGQVNTFIHAGGNSFSALGALSLGLEF